MFSEGVCNHTAVYDDYVTDDGDDYGIYIYDYVKVMKMIMVYV